MSLFVWALCFCGANAAVLSVTSFLLKLLTLFWFLSHELSVELNAYRSGLPTPINSADSSSPRCPMMKMGREHLWSPCRACIVSGATEARGREMADLICTTVGSSARVPPCTFSHLNLSAFCTWEGLGRGQQRMEEFIKSREQLPRLCEFWFVILKVFASGIRS